MKDLPTFESMVKKLRKPGENLLQNSSPNSLDIVHMTIGLATEMREMVQAIFNNDPINLKEEVGDYIFYLTGLKQAIEDEYEMPLAEPVTKGYDITGFILQTLNVCEYVKKHWVYGQPLDVANLGAIYVELEAFLVAICSNHEILVTEAMDENQVKLLKGRYTDGKYSDEQATARADKAVPIAQAGADAVAKPVAQVPKKAK